MPKTTKPAPAAAPVTPQISTGDRARIVAEVEEHIKGLGARTCACECGTPTKSTFAPGHDARLRSRLINERTAEFLRQSARGRRKAS